MPAPSEAEEHLRVIRSLMEKATIYRAISAPAAAVGGILAIAGSFTFGNWHSGTEAVPPPDDCSFRISFTALWVGVLLLTASTNFFFLWRDAVKRGDRFVSSGMRLALNAVLPSYLVAAVGTWVFEGSAWPNLVVCIWLICHGLGLLATAHFAPRSLIRLGWAFLIAGLISFKPLLASNTALVTVSDVPAEEVARWARHATVFSGQMWMAFTFGLFHLIYAACTWPRKDARTISSPTA